MLLLNWVCCLQKLSSLYIDGVRFLEFDVRARPRSVTCVHKTLTPRMKHTRVPRTVRRDIWRLAMETLSIPSLHSFWSRIRNQIKSRIENRKKTNGPNRKSNRLKYKKNPHTLCHIGLLLGLIDVVQSLHKLRTLRGNSMSRFSYFWPNESALRKICTSINRPYLIWAAVNRHVPPPKD